MPALALVSAVCILAGCSAIVRSSPSAAEPRSEDYAGFTRSVLTNHHLLVINVLPAEPMYTRTEVESKHPSSGELAVRGRAGRIVPFARHVEAHVYSRTTGEPQISTIPEITVTDHESGVVTRIEPTLMQDLVTGAPDLHFGNNIVIASGHDFTIDVGIDGERASVAGRLD